MTDQCWTLRFRDSIPRYPAPHLAISGNMMGLWPCDSKDLTTEQDSEGNAPVGEGNSDVYRAISTDAYKGENQSMGKSEDNMIAQGHGDGKDPTTGKDSEVDAPLGEGSSTDIYKSIDQRIGKDKSRISN